MKNKKNIQNIHNCDSCNYKLIKKKDFVINGKGQAFTFDVEECPKCGETYSNIFEVEKLRRHINPSFIQRIKNLFIDFSKTKEMEIFKGKVL